MFNFLTDGTSKNTKETIDFGSGYTQGTHWYGLVQIVLN
jgi:hypothetical protein